MDGSTGYYAKCSKSGREKQILCGFTYVESIKETNEQTKQNRTKRDSKKQRPNGWSQGRRGGEKGEKEEETVNDIVLRLPS